jgi:5-methylcytosine-specific restriction endonuclease McrA
VAVVKWSDTFERVARELGMTAEEVREWAMTAPRKEVADACGKSVVAVKRWREREKNPEKFRREERERKREWRARNPEKHRESNRKWYAKNPEKRREISREWRAKNPEKRRESVRKWQAKNPEKRREINRKWQAKNPEKRRESVRMRRAKKRGALVNGHRVTARKIHQIRMRFGWCCAACGAPLDDGKGHIDHFEPLARGGKEATWNLIPLCVKCNCSKGARDPLEWLRRKRYVKVFTRRLIDSGHWIDHPHFRHINAPDVVTQKQTGGE